MMEVSLGVGLAAPDRIRSGPEHHVLLEQVRQPGLFESVSAHVVGPHSSRGLEDEMRESADRDARK
jgi:hypothetical protein